MLLEHRDVPVSAALRQRVLSTTDEARLQRWFERALSASTADAVFRE